MLRVAKAAQQRRTPQRGRDFHLRGHACVLECAGAPALCISGFAALAAGQASIGRSKMPPVSHSARVCEICGSPIDTTSAGDLGCIACLIATGLDAEAEHNDAAFASAPDQLGAYTI